MAFSKEFSHSASKIWDIVLKILTSKTVAAHQDPSQDRNLMKFLEIFFFWKNIGKTSQKISDEKNCFENVLPCWNTFMQITL